MFQHLSDFRIRRALLMFERLRKRAVEPEWMDNCSARGPELQQTYRHLRRLNRIFGASGPLLFGVKSIWSAAGKPNKLTILDIGAGSGDVNRRLLRWADRQRLELEIVLADLSEEACFEAKKLFAREPRIRVMQSDLFALPERFADIVVATQFVHHFHSSELPETVRQMLRVSRSGVVINDIHRHWIPWAAVWLVTRIVSNNRYIRHDGPLSVAKGFRSDDWKELGESLGIDGKFYFWRPLFRYAVLIPKRQQ